MARAAGAFHRKTPALKARKLDLIRQAGAHLMGRVTYEEMAGFWPTADDEYAAPMNSIPKVVFSKSLTEAKWPTSTIAGGDLAEEVTAPFVLDLVDATPYNDGSVLHIYRPK